MVQLRQDDDEVVQLEALSQLNELLSISNEESPLRVPRGAARSCSGAL